MQKIVGKFDRKNIKRTVHLLNVAQLQRHEWYNCMGYALGVRQWLSPSEDIYYEYGEREDWINDLLNDYEEDEVEDIVLKKDVEALTKNFGLRYATLEEIDNESVELIAFREGVHFYTSWDGERWCDDSDFHFRKRVDGVWTEKCGSGKIKIIDGAALEEFDECWNQYYYSKIVYLVKR